MSRSTLTFRRPALAALAFCVFCASPGASAAPAGSVQVTTVTPQQTRFNQEIHGYGSLTAPPAAQRAVTLPWSGVVEAIAVHPGQRVKAGATLLTVAPDPGARAAWKRARAARDAARVALHQSEHLHADGLATAADLAQARRALHDAEAELRAQRRLGGAHARTTLHAPIAGVVGGLPTATGVRFPAGTVLASLVPVGAQTQVRLAVTAQDAATVRPGLHARLRSVFGDRRFDATVRTVAASVDPADGLVSLWLRPDAALDLPVGSAVVGTVEVPGPRAWALPRGAVVGTKGHRAVFQIVDGKAHRVPVQVVARQAQRLGVQGQLVAGRPVAVEGAYELSDGMRIRVSP